MTKDQRKHYHPAWGTRKQQDGVRTSEVLVVARIIPEKAI